MGFRRRPQNRRNSARPARPLSGLHLAHQLDMPLSFRRSLPIAGVTVLMTAALALADIPAGAAPHVRPETRDARQLLDQLTTRSITARSLVDRLDDSDVVVYVRHRVFTVSTLDGRIGFLQSTQPSRYLIVELACGRPQLDQLVTLGHELQHAVEIADADAVVDPRSLAAYYSRIGERTWSIREAQTFETSAARDISVKIRHELLGTAARTTHERH
jgi:hypothetical protein